MKSLSRIIGKAFVMALIFLGALVLVAGCDYLGLFPGPLNPSAAPTESPDPDTSPEPSDGPGPSESPEPSESPSASPTESPSASPSTGPSTPPAIPHGWSCVGDPGFSAGASAFTSIAFNGEGAPIVAFADGSASNSLSVMAYDPSAGTWGYLGSQGFLPLIIIYPQVPPFSLSTDADGNLYVAAKTHPAGSTPAIKVIRYSASSGWENLGLPFGTLEPDEYLSLDVDGSTPYVEFINSDHFGSVYAYSGSTPAWTKIGDDLMPYGATGYLTGPCSILCVDGKPYAGIKGTAVMGYDPATGAWGRLWESYDARTATSEFLTLGADGDGTLYAAYRSKYSGKSVSVEEYTGSGVPGWEYVGSPAFTGEIGDGLSFAVSPSGRLLVAFTVPGSGNAITVMEHTGEGPTGWECLGDPCFAPGPATYLSLRIAEDGTPEGTPYLVFSDGARGSKATVMRYGP
jgi:hypothetical protein